MNKKPNEPIMPKIANRRLVNLGRLSVDLGMIVITGSVASSDPEIKDTSG